MGESKIGSQTGIDDINKTIDEYRSIVDDIIQKEKNKLRQLYDKEANSVITGATQKAQEIMAASQKEAQAVQERIESQARKDAADIINAAKLKAQQVMSDAETRDKKEAKNRVRLEMENLLAEAKEEYNSIILKAKKDYDTIILDARKQAEKEVSRLIAKSKEEAEKLIQDDIAKSRIAAQEQLVHEIAEAQKKAKGNVDAIIASSADVKQAISQVIQKGDAVMANFKNDLQAELDELSKVIVAVKNKAEIVTAQAVEKTILAGPVLEANKRVVLSVLLKGEKPGKSGKERLYKGQMELWTDSADDYTPIRRLRDFLAQIPNIKFTGEVFSEDEASISFDVRENLPVLDILNDMPLVERLDIQPDGISLIIKS